MTDPKTNAKRCEVLDSKRPSSCSPRMTEEQCRESGYVFAAESASVLSPELEESIKHPLLSTIRLFPAELELADPYARSPFPIVGVAKSLWLTSQLKNMLKSYFKIDRVIFHDPATIVYWDDGTKTVVKCQPGDTYSKEAGLAIAFMKRALGDKGNFNDAFRKWVPEK